MSKTNSWKSEGIFSLMTARVKENPFRERDFKGTVQNYAYDLQKFVPSPDQHDEISIDSKRRKSRFFQLAKLRPPGAPAVGLSRFLPSNV
jgi:hypothetical protein